MEPPSKSGKQKRPRLVFGDACEDDTRQQEWCSRWQLPDDMAPRWYCRVQGTCVEFRNIPRHTIAPSTIRRGVIGQFTRQSRMRLLRWINKVDWPRISCALFVTLTYPDQFIRRKAKKRVVDRSLFIRYLEKHLGKKTPVFWRIEWERRKSGRYKGMLCPHWHLIVMYANYLSGHLVRKWWRTILNYGDGPLATCVKKVVNDDGAARYLAKYLSYAPTLDIGAYLNRFGSMGRHWGITRKHLVPMCRLKANRRLTDDELNSVLDYLFQRFGRPTHEGARSFTVLGADAVKFWSGVLNLA